MKKLPFVRKQWQCGQSWEWIIKKLGVTVYGKSRSFNATVEGER